MPSEEYEFKRVTVPLQNKIVKIIDKLAAIRGQSRNAFIRWVLLREIGRRGFLSEDDMAALDIIMPEEEGSRI